jgi:hypothetical protein
MIGGLTAGILSDRASIAGGFPNFAPGRDGGLVCGEQWLSNLHLDVPGERKSDSCNAREAESQEVSP